MSQINATTRYAGDDLYLAVSPGGHAQVLETNGKRGSAATPIELLLLALGEGKARTSGAPPGYRIPYSKLR